MGALALLQDRSLTFCRYIFLIGLLYTQFTINGET